MKKSHNIFEARANILPYEYPQLLEYKDAIRHSYWIDTEFNFTEDIQDFKINLSKQERDVIKKTMLSIAQIEVSVKTFWADMYKRMPIAEVGDVGMTFAESEVRHKDAYARLIRILGLEKEFETVVDVPAIAGRIKYLTKYLDGTRSRDNKMYAKSVLLFSLFIEHVSLFSQFLIMMSFNKDKNMLKGISAIQGNLNPLILKEDNAVIYKELEIMVSKFKDYPGYIFNLGHGITPDIDPDKIKFVTDTVREL